jgi:hypothetical protein
MPVALFVANISMLSIYHPFKNLIDLIFVMFFDCAKQFIKTGSTLINPSIQLPKPALQSTNIFQPNFF